MIEQVKEQALFSRGNPSDGIIIAKSNQKLFAGCRVFVFHTAKRATTDTGMVGNMLLGKPGMFLTDTDQVFA